MISNRQKAECADREAKRRKQVYPGYVARGRMTPNKARYEIEVMLAIADEYWAHVENDEPEFFPREGQK